MLDPFQQGNKKTQGKSVGDMSDAEERNKGCAQLPYINLLKTKPSITRLVAALNSFGQRQRKQWIYARQPVVSRVLRTYRIKYAPPQPCRQVTSENYSSAFLTVVQHINKLEFAERQIHSRGINLLKTARQVLRDQLCRLKFDRA